MLLAAGLAATAPACAQNSPQQKLQDVERRIEQSRRQQEELAKQAQDLTSQIQALRDGEVRTAAAAQAHEAMLDGLDAELKALTDQERAEAAELQRKREAEGQLLMALVRLARDPPTALALAPVPPVDAVRGGLLLGRAVPPLAARARVLGAEIARLESVRAQIAAAEAKHRTEGESLARDQARIAVLIERKQALQQKTQRGLAQVSRQQAALAAKAGDLRDLIARLEADRRAAARRAEQRAALHPSAAGTPLAVTAAAPVHPTTDQPSNIRPITQAKGRFAVPTSGLLIARFGEPEPGGVTSKGLTFETRPGGQVVAPFDGQVLYAGPFKGYGQILIIGHGGGYYSVLAGLDRIEQSVGQWLVAGEPVGVMPQGSQRPRLYLELRDNGQPINPLPWLAIHDEKVNG
ncbi:MAG: peptidoglycan DD-metalloendopeptidase family protein [Alphaproteobacteria bacterium]|nr:peptidoglycan DD-metalloendopeptidase family protein [Alphaproteobacteria bacterium]